MNAISGLLDTFNFQTKDNQDDHQNRSNAASTRESISSLQASLSYSSNSSVRHSMSSNGSSLQSLYQTSNTQLISVSIIYAESSHTTKANGFKVLGHELDSSLASKGALRSFSNNGPFKPEAFTLPSPDDVAKTVLGFVEQRLKAEQAKGASTERLDTLLTQAREGIEKGYGQAEEQIKQLGLMSDELSDEISKGFELIDQGLTQFSDRYIIGQKQTDGIENASGQKVDSSDSSTSTVASSVVEKPVSTKPSNRQALDFNLPDLAQSNLHSAQAGYRQFSARDESASIEIQTRDGDIVSISLSQIQAYFSEGHLNVDSDNNSFVVSTKQNEGYYSAENFAFSVEGELDEEEIAALTDLLSQIEGLADQFFGGDFQGAFENALSLGFDGSQIASFSVDLNITQVQQISTYERVSNNGGNTSGHASPFSTLNDFANNLLDLNNQALEHFKQTSELLKSILHEVLDKRIERDALTTDNKNLQDNLKGYLDVLLEDLA